MMLANDELYAAIFQKELLLDSYLKKIEFLFEKDMTISFIIQKKDIEMQFYCKHVKDFLFTCPDDSEYLIPSFKLFKKDSYYYLCFDPVSEQKKREEEDNDYILFTEFYAYIGNGINLLF